MIQQHLLSGLWKNYPENVANEHIIKQKHPIGKHLAEMLAIGPFYYYTIHTSDYRLEHSANAILSIHGIREYPETLQQIIDLIHPDDIDFAIAAEKTAFERMGEIGLQQQLNLKTSYCFRMRVADGYYHLFHHQTIFLAKDDKGHLITALHIHTDIQHITQVNNKIVLINSIGKPSNYYQIDLSGKNLNILTLHISKREREILAFLSQGFSSRQIAEKLFISAATVRVHRKNLLKKTKTTNSSSLIKKCAELDLM